MAAATMRSPSGRKRLMDDDEDDGVGGGCGGSPQRAPVTFGGTGKRSLLQAHRPWGFGDSSRAGSGPERYGGLPAFKMPSGSFNVGSDGSSRASPSGAEDSVGDAPMDENVKRTANTAFAGAPAPLAGKKFRQSTFVRKPGRPAADGKMSAADIAWMEQRKRAEVARMQAKQALVIAEKERLLAAALHRAEAAEAAAEEAQAAAASARQEADEARAESVAAQTAAAVSAAGGDQKLKQDNHVLKRGIAVQQRQLTEWQERALHAEATVSQLQEAIRLMEMSFFGANQGNVDTGIAGSRGFGGFDGFDPPPPDVF